VSLNRLGPEADNFRATLERFQDWGDEDGALRMAGALAEFWSGRNEQPEALRHLEAALSMGDGQTPARARALGAAAQMARLTVDPAAGKAFAEQGLALARSLGDTAAAADSMLWLGTCLADMGDFEQARQLFAEAAPLYAEIGDDLYALFADRLRAWMHYELGDRDGARVLHESNLVRARELGARDLESSILGALSEYAIDDGRIDDAISLVAASLRTGLDMDSRWHIAVGLCKGANTLAAIGQPGQAVQLVATSMAWYEEIGVKPPSYLAEINKRTANIGHDELGDAEFARAWETGGNLTLETAAVMAIEALDRASARS
jgi:tetratricopeptide (TPR) repeat protein